MKHSEYYVNKIMGFKDTTIEDYPHDGYCDICIDWRIFSTAFIHLVKIFDGYTVTYMGHTNDWVMFRFEDEHEVLKEAKLTLGLQEQKVDINSHYPKDYDESNSESELGRLFRECYHEFFES